MSDQVTAAQKQRLQNFFTTGDRSDLSVRCSIYTFRVHKFQLIQGSAVFEELLQDADEVIELDDDEPYALEDLLRHFYGFDYAPQEPHEFGIIAHVDVCVLALKYEAHDLYDTALKQFKREAVLPDNTVQLARIIEQVYDATDSKYSTFKAPLVEFVNSEIQRFKTASVDNDIFWDTVKSVPAFAVDLVRGLQAEKRAAPEAFPISRVMGGFDPTPRDTAYPGSKKRTATQAFLESPKSPALTPSSPFSPESPVTPTTLFGLKKRKTPAKLLISPKSPVYIPNSPAIQPTSPTFGATSPVYRCTSPMGLPLPTSATSPVFYPTSPTWPSSPNSPSLQPTSPTYGPADYPTSPTWQSSPTSPPLNPTSPISPTFQATSPTYGPADYPTSPSLPGSSTSLLLNQTSPTSPPLQPTSPTYGPADGWLWSVSTNSTSPVLRATSPTYGPVDGYPWMVSTNTAAEARWSLFDDDAEEGSRAAKKQRK